MLLAANLFRSRLPTLFLKVNKRWQCNLLADLLYNKTALSGVCIVPTTFSWSKNAVAHLFFQCSTYLASISQLIHGSNQKLVSKALPQPQSGRFICSPFHFISSLSHNHEQIFRLLLKISVCEGHKLSLYPISLSFLSGSTNHFEPHLKLGACFNCMHTANSQVCRAPVNLYTLATGGRDLGEAV